MMFLIIAVLVVVVLLAIFFLSKTSGVVGAHLSRGSSLLLIGPMGSGKTSLFFRLTTPSEAQPLTVTSQSPNKGVLSIAEVKMPVEDLPGHDSQWPSSLERLGDAKGVVFMVNSTEKDLSGAGQKLYDILCNPTIKSRRTPVLIACNMSDLPGAKSTDDIESELLEDLRDRSEMKDTIEDFEGNIIVKSLTNAKDQSGGELFLFEHSPCPIKMERISVTKGEIGPIQDFCLKLGK